MLGRREPQTRLGRALRQLQGRRRRLLPMQIACFTAVLVGFAMLYNPQYLFPQSSTSNANEAVAVPRLAGHAASRELLEFPRDVLLNNNGTSDEDYANATNKYWLVLHFIGVLYMFAGLAIVCDDYFVPALEEMCEVWKLSEDVAGATFMAAGGSAPELFTSLLGVFVAESNVGFGTIVGSAVFNVLFVIGLCAIFAKQALELTWWPLARDCTYYSIGLTVLAICVQDKFITWYESLILFCMYIVYVIIMKYNLKLKGIVGRLSAKCCCGGKKVKPDDLAALEAQGPPDETLQRVSTHYNHHKALEAENETVRFREFRSHTCRSIIHGHFLRLTRWLQSSNGGTEIEKEHHRRLSNRAVVVQGVQGSAAANQGRSKLTPIDSEAGMKVAPIAASDNVETVSEMDSRAIHDMTDELNAGTGATEADSNKPGAAADEQDSNPVDDTLDDEEGLFDVPESCGNKVLWALLLPLNILMACTIPDCSKDHLAKFFVVTFVMSLVWIAAFSYCMVWWASVIGFTVGIPDTVMGLTILAGGTSIPDALSSVIVARNGFGDMAVSSSIGSNIFDINVGLPVPWLLKTLITGEDIAINSCGLVILTVSLLLMVLFVVLSIKFMGWVLDLKLGAVMFVLYLLFLTESLLLEYKVIDLGC